MRLRHSGDPPFELPRILARISTMTLAAIIGIVGLLFGVGTCSRSGFPW